MAREEVDRIRRILTHLQSSSFVPLNNQDPRNARNGIIVSNLNGYYDSQNIVAMRDPETNKTVLSVVLHHTHNHEGGPGLRLYHTRSDDMGRTWTKLTPIEESLVRQSHDGYQLVYGNRIFVFYGYNVGSLTHPMPSLKHGHVDLTRSDMQLQEGYYVKVSLDAGRTFEKDRALIPIRRSKIDLKNPFGGKIMGMFCCDKPSIIGDSVYFAFQKTKEGGGETHGSEVWFARSRDFLRVDSPKDATWETLPHGEVGHQAPSGDFALGEEPHIIQADSSDPSRVFCLWRCEVGRIACAYSSDGGDSWEDPYFMTYSGSNDGSKEVRNPRGSLTPFKLRERTADGRAKFVLIFYNNGHTEREGYVARGCYWLIVGTETKSRTISWSQPELALFWEGENLADRPGWNADWAIVDGPGYPDFVQLEDGSILYVESNKLTVRLHKVPRQIMDVLINQNELCDPPNVTRRSLVLKRPRSGTCLRGPVLPELRSRSGGFTLCVYFRSLDASRVSPRQVLLSALSSVTATLDEKNDGTRILKGYTIMVVGDGRNGLQLELSVQDGFGRRFSQRTDSVRLFDGKTHLCCFVVDASPRVHSVIADDQLYDGGLERPQGWGHVPEKIGDCGGQEIVIQPEPCVLRPYPPFSGQILNFEIWDRPLLTSEAIGYWRYLKEESSS